jgi:glycosyltransferase involved in cell wall biosynthesis
MNFSKWAVVGFKDDTGIGRMTQDIQEVLGVGMHLVAPSERMETKEICSPREYFMPEKQDHQSLLNQMKGLVGIICLERLHWNPLLIKTAKELGLKIVCVPMWEWFRGTDTEWNDADLFLCPNDKAVGILHSYGFRNTTQVFWPLDMAKLPARKIEGSAKTFFHNAGLVDHDDRKGTKLVVKAFSKVKNPDLRLIIRMQQKYTLPFVDPRIEIRICNLKKPFELYQEGDTAIQPSRMEGLGFMVLEPVCCGLPVITTDAPPMNEYVCQPEMRIRPQIIKRKSFAYRFASIKHAYLTSPNVSNLAKSIDWCSRNNLASTSQTNRNWAVRKFDKKTIKKQWLDAINQFFSA